MNTVVLGLGSNLGDRILNLENALQEIEKRAGTIRRRSGFYASRAKDFVSENDFINMVVELETELDARLLLSGLEAIERKHGRKIKSVKDVYEDRLIDIDILFFNREIMVDEGLYIPHKNLYDRKFVLVPLVEILPGLVDPKTGKTSVELLKLTTDESQIFML